MIGGKPSLVVAEYIMRYAATKGTLFNSSKIIKLVYIAHGCHLAVHERPLINDRIDAWKHGPIIPLLYHELFIFQDQPIETYYYSGASVYGSLMDKMFEMCLSIQERNIIKGVVDNYMLWTSHELSELVREQNSPWDQRYNGMEGMEISDIMIMKYYKSEMVTLNN